MGVSFITPQGYFDKILRVILDTTRLLPELSRFSDEHKVTVATLTKRFKDYEFPVVTIKDRTNQEVWDSFQPIKTCWAQV